MKKNTEGLVEEFLERARKSGMIDALRSSAFVISVGASRPDLQIALQIGVALLWDKPLLIVLRRGEKVPQRLLNLADEVVQFESDDLNHPMNSAKLTAAIIRMTDKFRTQERRDGLR